MLEASTFNMKLKRVWASFLTQFALAILLLKLAAVAGAAIVSGDATTLAPGQPSVPVLAPVVHAAVLEAPIKPVSSIKASARGELDTSNRSSGGLLSKVKGQLNKIFHRGKQGHQGPGPTEELEEPAEAGGRDIIPSNDPDAHGKGSGVSGLAKGGDMTVRKGGNKDNVAGNGDSFKATSNDVVTPRMRLTSFIESIAASLEEMQMTLGRWFGHKKQPYEIVSHNATMLVARFPGKRFYSPQAKDMVKPARAVFHNHKLTVEVEEATFAETKDKHDKISEQVTGIGTEYQFEVKGAHVNVEDVYLRATNGEVPGYELYVPLQKETEETKNSHAISRMVARAAVLGSEVLSGHWGTNREEDEYDFLQAQLTCQKLHGSSGIRRMLCTCEKVHAESDTRRLLCISRVADKVVNVAKENNERKVAMRIYNGSVRCRNARYGIMASRDCLVKLLQKHAGQDSSLHTKHGRSTLSKGGDGAKHVDSVLAKEKMRQEEFMDASDDGGALSTKASLMMRLSMFALYVIGILLLMACLYDASRQYRRNNEESRSNRFLANLPEQARALYARLVMRS